MIDAELAATTAIIGLTRRTVTGCLPAHMATGVEPTGADDPDAIMMCRSRRVSAVGAASIYPKPLLVGADIIDGLILGAGIAIAGACPGTVAARVGVGYRDSLFTLAGGVLGAIAFIYLQPTINPMLIGGQRLTLDVATGLPFAPLAYGFAAILAIGLLALERWRPWRADLGANGDGYFEEEAESAARRGTRPHPAE